MTKTRLPFNQAARDDSSPALATMRILLSGLICMCLLTLSVRASADETSSIANRRWVDVRAGVGVWTSTLERDHQGVAGGIFALEASVRPWLAGAFVAKYRYGLIRWDAGPGAHDRWLSMSYVGPAIRFHFVEQGPVEIYADLLSVGLVGFTPSGDGDCVNTGGIATFPAVGVNLFVTEQLQIGGQMEYLLGGTLPGCSLGAPLVHRNSAPENPGVLQITVGATFLFGPVLGA
jgi:hypothetical protein